MVVTKKAPVGAEDTHTIAYAWANFGERGDPPECNTPEGPELIDPDRVTHDLP